MAFGNLGSSGGPGGGGGAGGGTWTTVFKTTNTTRNATATLAADPALAVPATASGLLVRGVVFFQTADPAGFQFRLSSANGLGANAVYLSEADADGPGRVVTNEISNGLDFTGFNDGVIRFEAIILSGSAEAVSFLWAQSVSDATDTKVLAGSYLEYAVIE